MSKKNKSAPSTSNTATANESVKKLDNITNIDNEIRSILGEDADEEKYVLFVKQWLTQSDGGNRWSYVGRITGEDMKDVQEKLLEYSSGLYRLEAHYEKSKKKVPGVPEYETAVGNMQDVPNRQSVSTLGRRVDIPNQQSRGIPTQSSADPVESHPDVVKAKVSAEVTKSKIEQVVAQKQLDKLEKGDDNMDANAQKILEMQTDKKISEVKESVNNAITQAMDKMTQAIASLKPSNNGELVRIEKELQELKSEKNQASVMQLLIESIKETSRVNSEALKIITEKQSQDAKHQHETTLKMIEMQGGQKGLGMEQFMKAVEWGKDIVLEKEQIKIDMLNAGTSAGEPAQPWYKQILEMISETLQELARTGALQQMITKSSEPQPKLLVPPDRMNAITQSITANVIAKVKSGEIKIPGIVINPTATTESKTETPPAETIPATELPTPTDEGSIDPEQVKRNIVNAILQSILLEINIKPKVIQWTSSAFDILPEDILNEIVAAPTQKDVIAVISRYADQKILITLGAKLLDKKNSSWLMRGIDGLKEMVAEENAPDETGNN